MSKRVLIFEFLVKCLPLEIKKRLAIKVPIIFILGTGRSGTTYLTDLLKSQSEISVYPTEANNLFHPKHYPYNRKRPAVPPIWCDGEKFSYDSSSNWNYLWLINLKAIFGVFVAITRGKIFVCKTVMLTFLLDKLAILFPEARFVFLVRNGYSVVLSQYRKEYKKFQDPIYRQYLNNADAEVIQKQLAIFWNKSNMNVFEFVDRNKSKCLVIKYEDLVFDPKKWMSALGEFMNVNIDNNSKYESLINGFKNMNYKAEMDLLHTQKIVIAKEIEEAMDAFGYA